MTIITHHTWYQFMQCQAHCYTPQMQAVLANIENVIHNAASVLKDDASSTVVVVNVDGRDLVIKRTNAKNWFYKLRRLFAMTRAQKNWKNAQKLLALGINTFEPIAILEERFGPLRKRGYFICSYVSGISASVYFAANSKLQEKWELAANHICDVVALLARNWISHRDLNLHNIILIDDKPWLIDLDAMRQHRWYLTAKRGEKRERERFLQEWPQMPEKYAQAMALFATVFKK